MARTSKKSVYERIEIMKNDIYNKEQELQNLNNELQELYKEKDQQEMELLLLKMKENGLDIESALSKLSMDISIKTQNKENKKHALEDN